MKQSALNNSELSQICQELAILLHAGISLGDGLSLLSREEKGHTARLLSALGRAVDGGTPLSAALEQSGAFPAHVIGMMEVGGR
jgi:type IV pilus assembly protein PilC